MKKKTVSRLFLGIVIIALGSVSLFKLSNSASAQEKKIWDLQKLEKIAEAGDIEAQARIVKFYKRNISNRDDHKAKSEYWLKKVDSYKTSNEYTAALSKLKKEETDRRNSQKERANKTMAELKAFLEENKGLDSKDRAAKKNIGKKTKEIMHRGIYSWKKPYTLRYRLTVNIKTPEGLKSGSTIQEVHFPPADSENIHNPTNSGIASGEAAYIDLGERGIVFAIMPYPSIARKDFFNLIRNVFPTVPKIADQWRSKEILQHYSNLQDVKAEIRASRYPVLVRFKDINDPKTIELVYKANRGKPIDRIEEFFGKGVKIENMFLEMTDDSLEWKLDNKLSWIESMKEKDITNALRQARPGIHISNGVGHYVLRQGFEK